MKPVGDQFDLSGNASESVRVRLYLDEIKPSKDRHGSEWMYIGVLAVQEHAHADVLSVLAADDSVLHFDDLRSKSERSPKLSAAKSWLNFVTVDDSPVRFKILGISMDRLNKESFGDEKVVSRAYHRFMRSAITALINGVFHRDTYSDVEVLQVIHDRTNHAPHWETLPLKKIGEEHQRVHIGCECIEFLNSDHRATDGHPEHSRMLQLIDLILGSFRYVMDAPEYKKNRGAEYLAKSIYGFVGRLSHAGKQFQYKRQCGISYFPKTSLTTEELFSDKRWGDHFFSTKPLLWSPRGEVQEELF